MFEIKYNATLGFLLNVLCALFVNPMTGLMSNTWLAWPDYGRLQ